MALFNGNSNNNNNNEYFGGKFSIVDNVLMTEYAAVPLSNISKIYVNDLSQKTKLPNLFWICAAIGIAAIFLQQFLVAIIGIAIAAVIFAYIYQKNKKHEYGLCIESNSGSVEMYKSEDSKILFEAQHQIEKSIIALNTGVKIDNRTYNINTGNVSYESRDVVVHGNAGNINTGNVGNGYRG